MSPQGDVRCNLKAKRLTTKCFFCRVIATLAEGRPDLVAGAILMVVDGAVYGGDRIAPVMTDDFLLMGVPRYEHDIGRFVMMCLGRAHIAHQRIHNRRDPYRYISCHRWLEPYIQRTAATVRRGEQTRPHNILSQEDGFIVFPSYRNIIR